MQDKIILRFHHSRSQTSNFRNIVFMGSEISCCFSSGKHSEARRASALALKTFESHLEKPRKQAPNVNTNQINGKMSQNSRFYTLLTQPSEKTSSLKVELKDFEILKVISQYQMSFYYFSGGWLGSRKRCIRKGI